jgi:ribonucleotide monophosphatase NagD (HAD superfamily)
VAAASALVVGDNPESDIAAARRAGIPSLLVLTGVADAAHVSTLEGERLPDWVARDPADVAGLLGLSLS